MEQPEVFMIVTEGGPHPGNSIVDESNYPWPLPGFIGDIGGRYQKVTESLYEPPPRSSIFVRGALYMWVPDETTTTGKAG